MVFFLKKRFFDFMWEKIFVLLDALDMTAYNHQLELSGGETWDGMKEDGCPVINTN